MGFGCSRAPGQDSGPKEHSKEHIKIRQNTEDIAWQAAFNAGRHAAAVAILNGQAVNKHGLRKEIDCRRLSARRIRQLARQDAAMAITTPEEPSATVQTSANRRLHRRDLPAPPNGYKDLKKHPMAKWFLEAMDIHMQSHREMKSFEKCHRSLAKRAQILDCMQDSS
jgi:hypothetical protein